MKRLLRALALLALLAPAALTLPACASTQPPAGTYTAPVLAQYNVKPYKDAILALSQSAIAQNRAVGVTHLSDKNTALFRDFALAANDALDVYATNGTTKALLDAWNTLKQKLPADLGPDGQAILTAAQVALSALGVQ